ncbi:MAG: acyltransferase family protein [Acidobacteriota bacterium]|nr:acyltransferase family protein [Acidobacteriota bacterium]
MTGRRSELAWHFAQIGVLIFFVHTCMVLMLSLERSRNSGANFFAEFYLRCIFRLYPLSIFCVTVAFVLAVSPALTEPVRHWTVGEYLSNLALTTNLTYTDIMVGGLWTLPLEMHMYLTLPLLFLLAGAKRIRRLLTIWAVSVVIAILQPHLSGRLQVLGFAPCFLAGLLAWRISLFSQRRLTGWIWPIAFVVTWPLFLFATRDHQMYYRWVFCLGLGSVLPWFSEISWAPLKLTSHFIAKYSYGIYLSHIAVMLFAFALPAPVFER